MAPRWQPLLENLEAASCGDLLTWEQAQELGFDIRNGDRWMIGQLRRRLWDVGRDLESERDIGYKLVCSDDAVVSGVRRSRNGIRKMRQGAHLISAAAANGLSRYDQQKTEDHANHLRRLADIAARRRLTASG